MIHRGPDDHGEEMFDCMKGTYHIGMAHRRLSVQDLSVLGHQPMHSDNGRVVVTFFAAHAEEAAAIYKIYKLF